jgi:hypothetical protein
MPYLLDPVASFAQDAAVTPISRAFNFKGDYWQFIELPENKHRLSRFGHGMRATASFLPTELIATGTSKQLFKSASG